MGVRAGCRDVRSASCRRYQLAKDTDPIPDLASRHVAEPDHQRGRDEATGSRVVWRDPIVAESSYGDSCGACLSDDSLLVQPGWQLEHDVVTGVETGDGCARHALGYGRDQGVAAPTVAVPDPAEVPVETTRLDEPRQRRLVELG